MNSEVVNLILAVQAQGGKTQGSSISFYIIYIQINCANIFLKFYIVSKFYPLIVLTFVEL